MLGCLGSGLLFLAHEIKSAVGVALCIMGVQFQVAVYDLMSEGRFSVITRDFPYTKSDIQTFTQALQAMGILIAVTLVGILSDYHMYVVIFSIIVLLAVAPLYPTLANYITESAEGALCLSVIDRERLSWKMVVLIVGIAAAAPVTGLVAQVGQRVASLCIALGVVICACIGTWIVFPENGHIIGRIAAFQVITYIFRPSLGSAMDYFYTSDAACLPDGPHFSMSYYIFIAGLISTVAGLVGIVLYARLLGNARFRTVLIVTSIIQGITSRKDNFHVCAQGGAERNVAPVYYTVHLWRNIALRATLRTLFIRFNLSYFLRTCWTV